MKEKSENVEPQGPGATDTPGVPKVVDRNTFRPNWRS